MGEVQGRSRTRLLWAAAAAVVVLVAAFAAQHRRTRPTERSDDDGPPRETGGVQREQSEPRVRPNPEELEELKRADSRATEARHRRVMNAPIEGKRLGPAGGVLMLCAAGVLFAAQMSLFPNTRLGEENATFLVAPAAVLALGGLNVVARPGQRHRLAGAFGLLAVVAVVLVATLNPHQYTGTMVLELVCAGVAALGVAPLVSGR